MELLNDNNVKEQFHKLIKKFITKKDDYDVNDFVGGLPITLENKDMFSLISKSGDRYKYTVTQKVDGTRMLMYIGYNTSSGKDKQRIVCFIDRNMKIYTLRDSSRAILPYLNTREMLLDGEIVFFDKDNTPHKDLQSRYVKGVSFMCFDILFGPENISVDSDGNKKIGQEFSFTVPYDGILKTYPWTYINRYDILYKLIIPTTFNKNEPLLTEAFKDINWFNIELKPIYFLNSLKQYKTLYLENNTGFLQKDFDRTRKNFYNNVLAKYGKQINRYISKPIQLDGLIFTSADTLYTIGPWNKNGKEQFKWKPVNLQTVDLLIKKIEGQKEIANVFISKGTNLEAYQIRYKPVIVQLPNPNIKDNSIGEFGFDEKFNLIFKESRPDKKIPNSLRTINNVLNSFKNPVDINDIYLLLNIEDLNKEKLKKIMLSYVSRPKLLNCVISNKSIDYLNEYEKQDITDMFLNVSSGKELEIRIGILKDKFFDTNIEKEKFENIKNQLNTAGYKIEKIDMVDIQENDIRTRYFYQEDFGKYIYLESIIKKKIKNIDINSKKFSSFDSRISLSEEIKVKQYSLEGPAKRKFRISYIHPKDLFRVDTTIIIKGKLQDKLFIEQDSDYSRQIEIEILNPNVNINELFNFIYSF
mgnify:CR=1 FL=1|tara:strand:- start:1907 stop:3829 length:1923 start_codon:yes stop_codon:yes gene_type:complete